MALSYKGVKVLISWTGEVASSSSKKHSKELWGQKVTIEKSAPPFAIYAK